MEAEYIIRRPLQSAAAERIATNRATPHSTPMTGFWPYISIQMIVVVVHPGFRSDRKDPILLVGRVSVAGGNVGCDLHAVDAGAGGDGSAAPTAPPLTS